MKVFFDTNVLLDVLATREAFYEDSAALWLLAEEGKIQGLISVISFNNIYYVVRKLRSRKTAEKILISLRDIFTPVALTEQVLQQAIDSNFKDFEDAIQYFSAVHAGTDELLTRNPHHYASAEIPVHTPSEFLALYSFNG